jgi:hypothetical protein
MDKLILVGLFLNVHQLEALDWRWKRYLVQAFVQSQQRHAAYADVSRSLGTPARRTPYCFNPNPNQRQFQSLREMNPAHAKTIYDRLADGSMPCDGPWPEKQIALLKQWIEEGMAPLARPSGIAVAGFLPTNEAVATLLTDRDSEATHEPCRWRRRKLPTRYSG